MICGKRNGPLRHRSDHHDLGDSDGTQSRDRPRQARPIVGVVAPVCGKDNRVGPISFDRGEDKVVQCSGTWAVRKILAEERRGTCDGALGDIVAAPEKIVESRIELSCVRIAPEIEGRLRWVAERSVVAER